MVRFAVLTIALVWLGTPPAPPGPNPVCTCATIQRSDGWCDVCKVGYLAGIKIESPMFFELLDAHGHQIDPRTVTCATCQSLYGSHGYCQLCKIGFVGKQLYFSKLTYYLARGEVSDAAAITCATCRKNIAKPGWCAACKIGRVGPRAYRDQSEFEKAAKLREILVATIPVAKECWSCALSMINDGTCLKCKKTFRDGERIPDVPP